MISFFLNIVMLFRTLVDGLRHDEEFRMLSLLLFFSLAVGTVFYWQVEHWPILDSLYFCVMTLSTVGYGDFVPTTSLSKIFTIAYTILGIGLFVSFVTKVVMIRIDHHKKKKEKQHNKTS